MQQFFQFVINHWFLWSVFILLVLAIVWLELRTTVGGVQKVSAQEVVNLINHHHAQVVDVRGEDAFKGGHIINAIHIPYNELEKKSKKLNKYKSKPIVVVCEQGITSLKLGAEIKKLGIEKVYSLSGGMNAWRSASLPVEN